MEIKLFDENCGIIGLEGEKWYVHIGEQYSQFFDKCNWYTFTFFDLEIEDCKNTGSYRVDAAFLGITFHWLWTYTETEWMRDLVEKSKEAIKQSEES